MASVMNACSRLFLLSAFKMRTLLLDSKVYPEHTKRVLLFFSSWAAYTATSFASYQGK